jgi:hypothetical protein
MHSEFKPMFTPYEMMELGIFDGAYYGEGTDVTNRDFETHPTITKTNLFKEGASQPLEKWLENGWIKEHDPMGWFQWYVRYYHGRRIEGYDEWQIGRWKSFVARHGAQVRKNGNGDLTKRLKQRQALLHWAADPIPDVDTEDKVRFLKDLL